MVYGSSLMLEFKDRSHGYELRLKFKDSLKNSFIVEFNYKYEGYYYCYR